MKILVAYASKTGTTARAAQLLAERLTALDADVELCDLNGGAPGSLADYDAAAVGGSIRMNMLHKLAAAYLKSHEAELARKPLGIFCCRCGKDDTAALMQKQLPGGLLSHAAAVASFGGELDLARQKGFDRFVVKMVSKSEQSGAMQPEGIVPERIDAFANQLVKAAQNA